MHRKVSALYGELDDMNDELAGLQTQGLLDGFEELLAIDIVLH